MNVDITNSSRYRERERERERYTLSKRHFKDQLDKTNYYSK